MQNQHQNYGKFDPYHDDRGRDIGSPIEDIRRQRSITDQREMGTKFNAKLDDNFRKQSTDVHKVPQPQYILQIPQKQQQQIIQR